MSFDPNSNETKNPRAKIGSDRGFGFGVVRAAQHGRLQLVMASDRTLSELWSQTQSPWDLTVNRRTGSLVLKAAHDAEEFYEDRGARISILARRKPPRPDTLKQTDQPPISTKPLADGAGHTFFNIG